MTIAELENELNTETAAGQALIELVAKDNRDLTPEEDDAQTKRFNRCQSIQKKLESHRKFASMAYTKRDEPNAPTVTLPKDAPGREEFEKSNNNAEPFDLSKPKDREAFSRSLTNWARTGEMDKRFATITTATASGAILPKVIAPAITPVVGNRIRYGMSLVGVQPISTSGTAEMNVPVILAAEGSDLSETATTATENGTDGSASIKNINLKVSTSQSGQVWVSNLELDSLDYDLLGAVVPGLVDAKEMRIEEKAFSAIKADSGVTQAVTLSGTTAAGLTYAQLVAVNRKPTSRFDRLKVLFLSNDAFAAAEALTGGDGHPVLTIDPANTGLYRFNGTPVVKTDYLDAFSASATVGILISFVGARLRDAGQDKMIRYANIPTKDDQTGMNLIGYHAFGYVPQAIVKVITSAS